MIGVHDSRDPRLQKLILNYFMDRGSFILRQLRRKNEALPNTRDYTVQAVDGSKAS